MPSEAMQREVLTLLDKFTKENSHIPNQAWLNAFQNVVVVYFLENVRSYEEFEHFWEEVRKDTKNLFLNEGHDLSTLRSVEKNNENVKEMTPEEKNALTLLRKLTKENFHISKNAWLNAFMHLCIRHFYKECGSYEEFSKCWQRMGKDVEHYLRNMGI